MFSKVLGNKLFDNNSFNRSWNNINLAFVKNYLRIEEGFTDDDLELELFMSVAKDYIKHVTDLTDEELAKTNTLVPAFLILVNELFTSRSATVPSSSKANLILDRYLNTRRTFL